MNRGLKSYTKQLMQEVGTAKACVNVNETDANMHMILPLIKTFDNTPFELNLIYNHQNRNEENEFVGKGFVLDCCADITVSDDNARIKNADGSEDVYIFNDDFHKETQLKVNITEDVVGVIDRYGNVNEYERTGPYFTMCSYKRNKLIRIIEFTDDGGVITLFNNGKILMTRNSDNLIKEVVYKYNDVVIASVNITYSSGRITFVEYRNQTSVVAQTSISYNAGDSTITLKDAISGEYIEYTYSGNKITSFKDTCGRITSISYNGKRTTVTDFMGNKSCVIFDENDFPRYEVDNNYNTVSYEFDKETKKLILQSEPIQAKQQDGNIFTPRISEYERSGVSFLQIPFTDEIFNEIIGTSVYMVTNGTGKFTKEISVQEGLATDTLTVAVFGKLLKGSAKIELSTGSETASAEFKSGNSEFDLVTFGLKTHKSYDRLKVTITLTNATLYLGDVQVIKKNFGAFYEYDDNGNLIKSFSRSTTQISYGANNLPTQSIGVDSTIVGCVYDDNNNLVKARTATGVLIENEYNANNNPVISKLTNKDGKVLKSEKEYDDTNRFVVKEIDSLGNTTQIEYTSDRNVKKVADALGAVTELSYKDNGLIEKLITKKDDESAEATYTYTDKRLLEKVKLTNSSEYGFVYDNKNRLTEVKLNDITVFSYEYDETTGNILRQIYGSGDSYGFTYRQDGLIDSVAYKAVDSEEETRYFYGYNDKNQLFTVYDNFDKYNSYYKFDSEGRVCYAEINDSTLNYAYDNLGNVNNLTAEKDGIKIHQAFDAVQRSHYTHPELFVGDNYYAFFETDADLKNTEVQFEPFNCVVKIEREGKLSFARLDNESALRYCFRVDPRDYNNDEGCILFWFKMDNINQKCSLCGVSKELSGNNAIAAYIENRKITVNVRDNNDILKYAFTSTYEIKEGWNFFALSFKNRNDGPGYPNEFSCSMTLNEFTQTNCLGNLSMNFGQNPIYRISLVNKPNIDEYLNGYVTAVIITPRRYPETEEVQSYYGCTKDFIADNQLIDKNVQTVDFGQTSVYTVNSDILSRFEIFPLRNNLLSLNGKKPTAFDLRRAPSADNDKTFNFNQKIKGYTFVADGSRLEYDFGQGASGTVIMRAYTEVVAGQQYLFDLADSTGKHLGLFLNKDKYLNVDINGKIISTSLLFTTGVWHTVGMSFAAQTSVYGIVTGLNIRIYLDGTEYNDLTESVSFGALKLSVGRKSVGNYAWSVVCPLIGQIEMLAVNNVFNELSTIQTLANELSVYSKSIEYDDLGLLRKTDIHKDGESILSHTYEPYGGNTVMSEKILAENVKYGNTQIRRAYDYDACGRIIFFEHTGDEGNTSNNLEYDYRGFLTKYNDETFEYDGNGNITKYGDTVFEYDSVIKDKLVSVGGTAVNYASAASLNPASWGKKSFKYEGRRLTSFTIDKTPPRGRPYRVKYDYEYDEQCHRIRKTTGSKITDYAYSGDKLVIEDGPNGKLFFLYDENGQLYGFVKDEKKYFYIKDITGTILGIVNESGTLVGKYSYTAYGNCTILVDTDGIATINPFRFKSYYYDTESDMYYCHTRYFVPEWGRWLNADSPSFLQFDDINGMNLFAYCCNDPVNSIDPNGTLSWNKFFKALAWIGLGISMIAANVFTGGVAGSVALLAVGATAGGLVGGYMNEAAGGSFVAGWVGGAVNGAIQTAGYLTCGYIGTIFGGGIGGGVGTFITESFNCLQQNKKYDIQSIVDKSIRAGFSSAITSIFTAGVQFLANSGIGSVVGGSIIDKIPGSVFGVGSATILSTLVGIIDDSLSYLLVSYFY